MGPGGAGDFVGAFDMHAVHQVPVGVFHFVEGFVAQDAGIVDHHVDAAKGVEGVLHNLVTVGDRVVVGFGDPARFANLGHHTVGRRGIGAFALGGTAEIVDQHLGPVSGEQQRMGPAQSAAGTGDDHDLILELH